MTDVATTAATATSGEQLPEVSPELTRPPLGMAVICFILFLTVLDNTMISATLADVQSSLPASVSRCAGRLHPRRAAGGQPRPRPSLLQTAPRSPARPSSPSSRELGAVADVAILGTIVNGQLTVNLLTRLAAIGIPPSYRREVVAASTTGSIGSEAVAYTKHTQSVQEIVNKVVSAAYGAFVHGLDIALLGSGALVVVSAGMGPVTAGRVRDESRSRETV